MATAQGGWRGRRICVAARLDDSRHQVFADIGGGVGVPVQIQPTRLVQIVTGDGFVEVVFHALEKCGVLTADKRPAGLRGSMMPRLPVRPRNRNRNKSALRCSQQPYRPHGSVAAIAIGIIVIGGRNWGRFYENVRVRLTRRPAAACRAGAGPLGL